MSKSQKLTGKLEASDELIGELARDTVTVSNLYSSTAVRMSKNLRQLQRLLLEARLQIIALQAENDALVDYILRS